MGKIRTLSEIKKIKFNERNENENPYICGMQLKKC